MSQQTLPPLCVDLDGTLIRTNSIIDAGVMAIKRNPLRIFPLFVAATKGRAHVKEKIGIYTTHEQLHFVYNTPLIAWLKEQKSRGRKLILATASDTHIATFVANHLALFEEIIASTAKRPIEAATKHIALKKHFSSQSFSYAGNSRDDISIWNIAASAVIVDAPESVQAQVVKNSTVEKIFKSPQKPVTETILQEIRIHQWLKNLLLFIPAIMAHRIDEPPVFVATLIGFLSFSFLASAMYVFNDILDLQSDRAHATKHTRPIAAGLITIPQGIGILLLLGVASMTLAYQFLPYHFFAILALYIGMNFAYSWIIKRIPYIDILFLASLYVLRIFAGGMATNIATSKWLFLFAACIFICLASLKRVAELVQLPKNKNTPNGRGYTKKDTSFVTSLGIASGVLSCIVLGFYITSSSVLYLYNTPTLLWITVPVLGIWIARIWRIALLKKLPDDPVLFASRDPISYAIIAIMAASMILAK